MKTFAAHILISLFLCMATGKLFAWYPDYTVMATDFVLPADFLESGNMTSVRQMALGPYFRYLYLDEMERTFRNPASLGQFSHHYLYMDVAGNQQQETGPGYVTPAMYDDRYIPYYWSPYRITTNTPEREPLFRLAYFGKPFSPEFPLSLGMTMAYSYDQQPFYQPYWYYYGGTAESATGVKYDQSPDPYNDYRQMEAGNNLNIQRGLSTNLFLAYAVKPRLFLGIRYGIQMKNSDGNYLNMDKHNEADWADDYLNYSRAVQDQKQDNLTQEISGGLLKSYENGSSIGFNIGMVVGDLSREYSSGDTSMYRYYRFIGPDTFKYSRSNNHGNGFDNKKWDYNGKTFYSTLHGERVIDPDVTLRFTMFGEHRLADLTESENSNRRYYYHYYYWYDYNSVAYASTDHSREMLTRSGTGTYRFSHITGSVGGEWHVTSSIRFLGGIYLDYRKDQKQAREPFQGNKFSDYSSTYPTSPGYQSLTKLDDKVFKWHREETYTTVAFPTGVLIEAGKSVEFQVGLTKVIRSSMTDEGYDLVVYHDKEIKIYNNNTSIQTDSAYVEGHDFPGTNNFSEEYQMNTGISLKFKQSLRVTGALQGSVFNPREFKIGAEFTF